MTVIRVHELAKKMGVESKDLVTVLEKMGIKGKTASSGLDDKETKSLIEKLKAVRKEKEKGKKEKEPADPLANREERLKKAAALIGKFSSTLEKPGAKPKPIPPLPKPVIPAPPVIPPATQVKSAPDKPEEMKPEAAAPAPVSSPVQAPTGIDTGTGTRSRACTCTVTGTNNNAFEACTCTSGSSTCRRTWRVQTRLWSSTSRRSPSWIRQPPQFRLAGA